MLNLSYTCLAPIYNAVVKNATQPMREYSIARLGDTENKKILIGGIGTGLDLPLLPANAKYTGLDMNAAMLARAKKNIPSQLDIDLQIGSIMKMPYADASADTGFDKIILHLIVSVAGDPLKVLQESLRVLKPGGSINILDKFLRPGQKAPLRRGLNPIMRRIATRTDVIIEEVLSQLPALTVNEDTPLIANGWFRFIQLTKNN